MFVVQQMWTYIAFRMQFDEIFFAFKAQLSNFGPREGVDFGEVLEDHHTHVGNRKVKWNTFVVLCTENNQ
jgi:hypothetical protein